MKQSRWQYSFTASEVGEFVFCAKAWKLKRAGVTPDSPRLEAGTEYHQAHQAGLYWARFLRRVGLFGILLVLFWLLVKLKLHYPKLWL